MKYIPSIAFEEMSGSAKGVTAAKTRGRKYIRNRGYGGSVRTSDQASVKAIFKKLSQAWQSLTDAAFTFKLNSVPSVTTNLKLIICASAPQSNGISHAYSKAAEIGGPETPSTTAVDIQDDYEAKYGAVGAGNPKVFFKYFYVNTATGEKSGEMLAVAKLASSDEQPEPENQGGGEGGDDNPGGGIGF